MTNTNLFTLAGPEIQQILGVSDQTIYRWLTKTDCPREMDGSTALYRLADILPRILQRSKYDLTELFSADAASRGLTLPDEALGSDAEARATLLYKSLDDAQSAHFDALRGKMREALTETFWDKVQHLDLHRITIVSLIHPVILRAGFGDDSLPSTSEWQHWCVNFTLANATPAEIRNLTKEKNYA